MRKALLDLALIALAAITTYGSASVTPTAWQLDVTHKVVIVCLWIGLSVMWVALVKLVCTKVDTE